MGLGDCVVCRTAAKYKCPLCGASGVTCSVACSKLHKAQHAAEATAVPSESLGVASSSQVALAATADTGASASTRTARLNENELLRDYIFLSEMTRQATSVGRELAQATWARQGVEDSALVTHAGPAAAAELALQKREREQRLSQRGGHTGQGLGGRGGGASSGSTTSRIQARRDFLAKQARFLRIPLLLLPIGMDMAMKNRSGWLRREMRMEYTIQVAPRGHLSDPRNSIWVHHQPPDALSLSLLLDKLERQSGKSPTDAEGTPKSAGISSKSKKRRRKGGTASAVSSQENCAVASKAKRIWAVARPVFLEFLINLALCSDPRRTHLEAHQLAHKLKPTMTCPPPPDTPQSVTETVYLSLQSISKAISLVLPLAKHALRNESTTKYIDWYQRQLTAGQVERYDPSKQGNGARGANSGAVVPTAPLLSSSLLNNLAAQLVNGSRGPDPSVAQTPGRAGPKQPRSMLRVPPRRGIQQVLQGIPNGWGLVEFPTLELWLSEDLAGASATAAVDVLEWQRPERDDGHSPSSSSDADGPDTDAEQFTSTPAKRPCRSTGLGLGTYASDSDAISDAGPGSDFVGVVPAAVSKPVAGATPAAPAASAAPTAPALGLELLAAYGASDDDGDADDQNEGKAEV